MSNEINKPASMVINEFRYNIEKAIKESGLPPVIMEPIFSNYLSQLQVAAREQTLSEMKSYEESLKKEDKK